MENGIYPPFRVYSPIPTRPQGMELLVQPLVKSLFCPINPSPNEFLVGTPLAPPPPPQTHTLETHFFWGGGGAGGLFFDTPPLFG